jgi:hypothetical protein
MKKNMKPNISPLEVEIENKITFAHLLSMTAQCGSLSMHMQFHSLLQKPMSETKTTNHKSNQNESN